MPIKNIGNYTELEPIGAGRISDVYKAQQVYNKRIARAVKIFRFPVPAENAKLRAFIIQEATAACELYHDNIVRNFEFGIDGNFFFIVSDLMAGPSLDGRLVKNHHLTPQQAHKLAADAAAALNYAHELGILHRCLSPRNIFFKENSTAALVADFAMPHLTASPLLADFAKTLQTDTLLHFITPPETDSSGAYDSRSDIYQLGALVYLSLAGYNSLEISMKPSLEKLREDVSESFTRLIMQCLSPEPAKRPVSARAILNELIYISPVQKQQRASVDSPLGKLELEPIGDTVSNEVKPVPQPDQQHEPQPEPVREPEQKAEPAIKLAAEEPLKETPPAAPPPQEEVQPETPAAQLEQPVLQLAQEAKPQPVAETPVPQPIIEQPVPQKTEPEATLPPAQEPAAEPEHKASEAPAPQPAAVAEEKVSEDKPAESEKPAEAGKEQPAPLPESPAEPQIPQTTDQNQPAAVFAERELPSKDEETGENDSADTEFYQREPGAMTIARKKKEKTTQIVVIVLVIAMFAGYWYAKLRPTPPVTPQPPATPAVSTAPVTVPLQPPATGQQSAPVPATHASVSTATVPVKPTAAPQPQKIAPKPAQPKEEAFDKGEVEVQSDPATQQYSPESQNSNDTGLLIDVQKVSEDDDSAAKKAKHKAAPRKN